MADSLRVRYYKRGRRTDPKVALTFDDGPNPPRTDEVLAILREFNVKASFFVIGKWVNRWPKALERILAEGHTIGNHSYLHHREIGDFDKAEAEIAAITGRPSRFLRWHYNHNARSCLSSPTALAPSTTIIECDVNPDDWAADDPDVIVQRVLTSPSLGPGSIIDLHDGSESENDAERLSRPIPMIRALPAIISGLREKGLEPVSLDEMTFDEPYWWP